MMDYTELVKALRHCSHDGLVKCNECKYGGKEWPVGCEEELMKDAATAIEALQAEVQFYKAVVENKERLLGLYRAEQAKHFYSETDDNGRIKANPCACMNIPVFPDSSESPNGEDREESKAQLPKQGEWNNHEVACLLAEMFGDDCACNLNGIDEWLPQYCEFAETCCPNPGGVACWEQFLKHRAKMEVQE